MTYYFINFSLNKLQGLSGWVYVQCSLPLYCYVC